MNLQKLNLIGCIGYEYVDIGLGQRNFAILSNYLHGIIFQEYYL